ncbi:MAG: hypothetical protein ACJAVI_002033 [Candidatus Azotimanducaceae bacterium]|jgi:hypothetical protein
MTEKTDTRVSAVFESFDGADRAKLEQLRGLVMVSAKTINPAITLEESLKWGEPSYVLRGGSPTRLGWSKKALTGCAIFFHCQTSLVETFKALYGDRLVYDGKRAFFPATRPFLKLL